MTVSDFDGPNWREDPLENTPIVRRKGVDPVGFASTADLARALGDPDPERTERAIEAILRRGSLRIIPSGKDTTTDAE